MGGLNRTPAKHSDLLEWLLNWLWYLITYLIFSFYSRIEDIISDDEADKVISIL